MSPPQQQLQQVPFQQGQPPVPQRQTSATRPRPVIDLTNSDDERVPKRPRMASDPNVYTQRSPRSTNYLQHQMYAQMPAPAPHQIIQQRSQMVPMDHMQNQPVQQYYTQRSGTAPINPYQYAPPSAPPFYVGPNGATFLPNTPAPPISAPPVMDIHGAVAGEQDTTQIRDQMQANGQPVQVHPDRTHPTNLAEVPTKRSTGIPSRSTSAAPPPGSVPVSPRATMSGRTHGGELILPQLTEEQTEQMRSELADSMFTEAKEGDETQARTCVFCE